VVIDALVEKYCDHLPLYRQSAILEREGRRDQPGDDGRMGDAGCELLTPITEVCAGVTRRKLHSGR